MSEPFIGEIKIFGGNFAPRGYAFCEGGLLPVAQNTALFSIIGTIYGGDGRTTLGLPDLKGRAPMHAGQGPGLSYRLLGAQGGEEAVELTANEMPTHDHTHQATTFPASTFTPDTSAVPSRTVGGAGYIAEEPVDGMADTAIANTGGSQAHNNAQPFLTMNFIIALTGRYPTRS